ncbi:MAG: ABC transporter permease [Lachnospiraceae bacterium]|nr:ABC transporter permease [Lachnospiraceae bacterium]
MLHLIKYRFFSVLREKTTMFWGFVFPLILCTLFYVTFGDIDNTLDCINTAAVVRNDTTEAKAFEVFLKAVEDSGEDLFAVEWMEEKEAKEKLEDGKISGVFYVDTEPELFVAGSGMEESVLQAVLESYMGRCQVIQDVLREKPEELFGLFGKADTDAIYSEISDKISSQAIQEEYVTETSLGGKKTDGMIQYFFSLIGMTCMFGCFLGFDSVMTLQANISPVGARRCVGSVSKFRLLMIDFILICIVNYVETIVLFVYMTKVLKLDMGNEWGKNLLIAFLGCLVGVAMGILVGSIGKWKEGTKIAVMLSVSLGSSFLSGLMVSGIKGLIEEKCPIINRINPASLISDAFYSVAIYQDGSRYVRDVVTMAVLAVIFLAGSFLMVRRVRYDSI